MRLLVVALFTFVALALPVSADSGLSEKWEEILANACNFSATGARVECLSRYFLGTPYRAGTLGGGPDEAEQLIAELEAVDCFTLLDYVEALRRSKLPTDFTPRLTEVRYRDGIVSWSTRRHFFSDWLLSEGVVDVTATIAPHTAEKVEKVLNRATDGTSIVPGVAVRAADISYLPTDTLTPAIIASLQPGDYIGIYSPKPGLDVSHVGILVSKKDGAYLRHASSHPQHMAVVDEPLLDYLDGKPGIVVLRPVVR